LNGSKFSPFRLVRHFGVSVRDSDLINVRFGLLRGLTSDIF
jgi:hypothetical protein